MKEENSSLAASFGFVDDIRGFSESFDIIVAGGSMRRHQFLANAGANSFLAERRNARSTVIPDRRLLAINEITSGKTFSICFILPVAFRFTLK